MTGITTFLETFRQKDHERLFEIIKQNNLADEKMSEKIVYAIYAISELIETIYLKNIPEMISTENSSAEKSKEIFEDLKFNFNEIRQLIETAKLTGLKYWDSEDC